MLSLRCAYHDLCKNSRARVLQNLAADHAPDSLEVAAPTVIRSPSHP